LLVTCREICISVFIMTAEGAFKPDFAVERFNRLREENYKRFRWTRTTVRSTVLLGIVVPAVTYVLIASQQDLWDWRGTLKGEPLIRAAPKQEENL